MASEKSVYSSNGPYEKLFGYSRSVRKGPFICVSGTTALKLDNESDPKDPSKVMFSSDAMKQAQVAMQRCVEGLEKLGGRKGDVMRVRMFVSRHEDCEAVGSALREVFINGIDEREAGIAATMNVVKDGFIDPDILVEVEVDAFCG